ncbi:acyltransferase family protein [Roseateles sp. LYH14W]|uniref:Acyltransferase family protein n=1 Tax=Pelomonas parva TaxID=3299032 RepID=A0ABW7EW25_9BURK
MRFRPDIEGLRALAIVPVVVFHAWPAVLPGGYVGVDVFFVISGYLITSLLLQRLENGSFSIGAFYSARIRRIFPALFVMLAAVAAASWLLLTPSARVEFARTLGATAVFASNLELYRTTGYFDGATDLKPLVHTWSLAVEEQYYIFFPLLLAALYRRARGAIGWVLAAVGLASLAYSQWLLASDGPLAFYSALSRTFELMVGSLLAVRVAGGGAPWPAGVRQALGVGGVAAIVSACVLLKPDSAFPGLAALWPCLGAAALIEAGRGQTLASRMLALPPLRWVGALSFSLYLWHWPLLVFARHGLMGHPSAMQAAVAVALAVALAWVSLRWVEMPLRRADWPERRWLLSGAAASGVCLLVALGLWWSSHRASRTPTPVNALLAAVKDHSPSRTRCHAASQAQIAYEGRCQVGQPDARHQLVVWGDSHGIEVGEALGALISQRPADQQPLRSLALLTASRCPPAVGYVPSGVSYCRMRNEAVLAGLLADARADRVLIAGRTSLYMSDASEAAEFEQGLQRAVQALAQAGKKVWLLDPVPTYEYSVPAALAQRQRFGWSLEDFGMPREDYLRREGPALALLARVAAATGARRIDVAGVLCAERCAVISTEGLPLYFDDNHVSMAGARLLVRQALQPLVD